MSQITRIPYGSTISLNSNGAVSIDPPPSALDDSEFQLKRSGKALKINPKKESLCDDLAQSLHLEEVKAYKVNCNLTLSEPNLPYYGGNYTTKLFYVARAKTGSLAKRSVWSFRLRPTCTICTAS